MDEKTKAEVFGIEDREDGAHLDEQVDPVDDKRILRKLDRYLLPVMAVSYFFQYLDKSTLSSAAIMGLNSDLHLSGEEYSWSSGIYYFGYLIASYPASYLMVKWNVGRVICCSILAWGAVLMLMAASTNASGLLATRFFLGAAEAAIAPGFTILISMFYKREEQPLRQAAWFLGNTCAGLFAGLMNYGIGHINGIAAWKVTKQSITSISQHKLTALQASFLIFGGATVTWGICNVFLLPDSPARAWFFNKTEAHTAVLRVKNNMTGMKNNKYNWSQLQEALLDYKTWFFFFIQLSSNIPNGGVTTFRSLIIKGIGFSTFDTLLLQCVPYLVQLALVISCTVGSTYLKNTRTYWMMMSFAIALLGAALVRELPEHDKWGRYAGTCLMGANSASFPLLMAMISSNIGGFTKKAS
ncbi:hypothetical protein Golomagni_06184, partial [Golovinomyces magnicellulatus]